MYKNIEKQHFKDEQQGSKKKDDVNYWSHNSDIGKRRANLETMSKEAKDSNRYGFPIELADASTVTGALFVHDEVKKH